MNKKYAPYIFASIMAVAKGIFMSFFLTWINTGFAILESEKIKFLSFESYEPCY